MDDVGRVNASADDIARMSSLSHTSNVLNAASNMTDGAALADSTYGLAKNWENLSAEQRLMAIGQIGFWGGMMAHSAKDMGAKSPYASGDVDRFMHSVGSQPKNPLSPESRPVMERVEGAVREAVTISEADAKVLKSIQPGDEARPIELSTELRQQLDIYNKNVTSDDVLRRLKVIENKQQQQQQPDGVAPPSTGEQPKEGVTGNPESRYDRAYPSATDKPKGMPLDMKQVREQYGEHGVNTVERTHQKADEIASAYRASKGKKGTSNPGPVLSGVLTP